MVDYGTIDHSMVGKDTEMDNTDYYNKVFYPNTILCVHNGRDAAMCYACRVCNRNESNGLVYSVCDAVNAPRRQAYSQTTVPPAAAP
jgi:hypothetical protein